MRALGPIAAQCGGRPVALGGHKQRTVLALLVLRANVRVSTDDLVEAVWGPGESTSRWLRTLQVYVANLRGLLHLDAKDDGLGAALTWDGHGYQLRLGAEHCDVAAFRRLLIPLSDMGEADRLHAFTRGLKPAIATQLRVHGVQTTDAAIEMAVRVGSMSEFAALASASAGAARHTEPRRWTSTSSPPA